MKISLWVKKRKPRLETRLQIRPQQTKRPRQPSGPARTITISSPDRVADLLDAAREYIIEHGWIQGEYRDGDRVCAVGAIESVQRQFPGLECEARAALAGVLPSGDSDGAFIPTWNDDPGRSEQEVLETFQVAAKRMRNRARQQRKQERLRREEEARNRPQWKRDLETLQARRARIQKSRDDWEMSQRPQAQEEKPHNEPQECNMARCEAARSVFVKMDPETVTTQSTRPLVGVDGASNADRSRDGRRLVGPMTSNAAGAGASG